MKNRTVLITKIFVAVFALALAALLVTAPMLVEEYADFRGFSLVVSRCILFTFYLCSIPASIALFCLWMLLRNIRREQIFVFGNSRFLSALSWCCMAVTCLTLAAAYHYLPFALVAVAMLFIFLIVRVVCSCMAVGTRIKEENNLTI